MTQTTPTAKLKPASTAAAPKVAKPAEPSTAAKASPKPAAKPKAVKAKPTATKTAAQAAAKPVAKSLTPVAKAATAPSATRKSAKEKKVKVVRDSFTLPKTELLQITDMKKRAMTLGVEVKKSELIRAGLQALSTMTDAAFKKALGNVPTIKTGRPAKT